MLENYLHSLIKDILIKNIFSNKNNFLEDSLKTLLKTRNDFFILWRKKFDLSYNNINFSYTYNIIEENKNFIKCILILNTSSVFYKNIFSSYVSQYLLIIEKSFNSYKIISALNSEEDSDIFNKYIKLPLYNIKLNINSIITKRWFNHINNIDDFFYNYISNMSYDNIRYKTSVFNIQKAVAYAETYAIIPNSNYENFELYGGDCTNFVSQILHAGNINTTRKWKPYTNSWIRVEEFYKYIINNEIGMDTTNKYNFSKGSFLQFSTFEKNRFFHSGFITHELKNDCLYCCHTYNKLNYPLSQIYPFIYPLIRIIKIY